MRNTFIFLLFLLLPLSCGDSPAHHALDEAEKWLDRQPDSVRHWLEKMEIPAGKDSFERARYQLIQATLSVKRGNGDIADEHLPECISVFLAAHDSVRLVRSYYQLALACQYRKQYKKADSLFTEGARYATGAGQACLYTGRMDSALLYYRQAAGLCIPDYLADRRSYLCRKIIDLYRMKGEFRTALEYLKTNIAANRSRREVPYYLLTKARLCLSAGETDSARLYLTRTAQSEDGYAAACAFEYLARLYEPDDPERSFYARQSYGDLIHFARAVVPPLVRLRQDPFANGGPER